MRACASRWMVAVAGDTRLRIKRLRNKLRRLRGVALSAAAIHKVLVRHQMNVLAPRRRGRHRPKRYTRPVPGDRVQLDTFCHWALGSSGLWSLARGVLLFVIGAMAVT